MVANFGAKAAHYQKKGGPRRAPQRAPCDSAPGWSRSFISSARAQDNDNEEGCSCSSLILTRERVQGGGAPSGEPHADARAASSTARAVRATPSPPCALSRRSGCNRSSSMIRRRMSSAAATAAPAPRPASAARAKSRSVVPGCNNSRARLPQSGPPPPLRWPRSFAKQMPAIVSRGRTRVQHFFNLTLWLWAIAL